MVDALSKDCEWILRGDLNMRDKPKDKSNDYGRAIKNLERYKWNELLN